MEYDRIGERGAKSKSFCCLTFMKVRSPFIKGSSKLQDVLEDVVELNWPSDWVKPALFGGGRSERANELRAGRPPLLQAREAEGTLSILNHKENYV